MDEKGFVILQVLQAFDDLQVAVQLRAALPAPHKR